MIICSHSNIDIIQGVIGYGDAEGITDWRITNTNAGILNILNSTSTNARLSILENGNVGIGTTNPASMLDIVGGDTNITGVYKKNNRDVINDTSNYVLSTSNVLVPRILSEVGNGSNYISRLISPINTRIDDTSNYMLSTSNILVNRVGNSQWTNMSSGIYYAFPSFPNITVSPSATIGTTGSYTFLTFTYTTETAGSGSGQTLYTINVPINVLCDILIVGGGGAGGDSMGGGGGAGGVVYAISQTLLQGTYTVKVGRGGIGGSTAEEQGTAGVNQDGKESSLMNSDGSSYISLTLGGVSQQLRGYGGGGGGVYYDISSINGRNGGSGGGCSEKNADFAINTAGSALQPATYWNGSSYVVGGKAGRQNTTTAQDYQAGGGGGLGTLSADYRNGNDGVAISITGTSQFYAAGGGAGQYIGSSTTAGLGGSGIGGNGRVWTGSAYAAVPRNEATSGTNGTGSGGGGSAYTQAPVSVAGSGGSGIVIIRFLSSAANVGANVGIGTANPISKLHIYDDETNITKLTIQNNSIPTKSTPLPTQITVAGATSTTIGTSDICTSFPYSGSGTTKDYTFTTTEELICDILLIGGGGGGGYSYIGGGGGGGGYIYIQNINFPAGTYNVNVGSGGAGGINGASPAGWGVNGNNSSITGGINYTALGGGGGAGGSVTTNTITGIGSNGGSGGGGSYRYIANATAAGGTSIQLSTYGYGTGGNGNSYGSPWQYGGGGGGASGYTNGTSPIGNNGLANSITGVSITYAGGGGAGSDLSSNPQGGSGGGGAGGNGSGTIVAPVAGTDGLGGGGGGARGGGAAAAAKGGSGIIIIRYRRAQQGSLIELKNTPSTLALPNLITVSDAISTTLGTTERCILFPYSGTAATTTYTFTTTEPLIHDILLIGGGGGGGVGGGGGGGYLYITNIYMPAGTYTVTVGKGGSGTGTTSANGTQGSNSSFSGGTISYIAYGGGGGAGAYLAPAHTLGQVGSYGGNGVDSIVAQTYTSVQGNRGGLSGTTAYGSGGGGGGADAVGGNAVLVSGINPDAGRSYPYYRGGKGGDGKPNSITGMIVYYAGGGNGGANTNFDTDTSTQTAPLGGGGLGARAPNQGGSNGTNGLGGGGGGRDYESTFGGGDGGSGVVIIRYRKTIPNIDYKIGNFNDEFKIISSESSIDTDYIRITSTGASIYNPTASPQWSTVSDRRIKENIEKASYNKCYDNINKLELYRFNYIAELKNINKDLKQLGYIAQEVQDIFPKAVSTQEFHNDNLSIPDMLSIDIAQINYSLYGAVKKLIEIDNNKEARIQKMENLLNINNTSSNIIDTSSNIDISSSNIDTSSSNIDISSSNIIDTSSNIDISSSNINTFSSNIDISSSNIIDTSSNIIDTSSNIDTSSSNIDISSSNIDISSSNITDISSSNIDISSSNIDISSSNIIDTSSSNIDISSSNIDISSSNI